MEYQEIADEEDLKEQRASSYALAGIRKEMDAFQALQGLKKGDTKTTEAEQKELSHLNGVVRLLEYLQEEPQLIDPHLKFVVPNLVDTFIPLVSSSQSVLENINLLRALSRVLYTLCKVRGEKVIVRFLNNEARYIQPLLETFSLIAAHDVHLRDVDGEPAPSTDGSMMEVATWKLRYVLLLWIGHLMLTPFDLNSISSENLNLDLEASEIILPDSTPPIARQVIGLSVKYLSAPTKEQSSAATTLVKLVSRPDMQKIGVLDTLVMWTLTQLPPKKASGSTIHALNGILLFLNGLIRATSIEETHQYIPLLFDIVGSIFGSDHTDEAFLLLRDSAVSKKLSIKIQKNIMIQILQVNARSSSASRTTSEKMLQDQGALEESIDYLLTSVAHRDTQVRYAASKALGVISSVLEPEFAKEVIEAVLASMRENVRTVGDGKNRIKDVSAVNALGWHGLTMTLAHVLFLRIPSPQQLAEVLGALYSSLTFEQRSTTGSSLGLNVRDAANFGLWSLARRYSSAELAFPIDSGSGGSKVSALQETATQLVVSACLDPSGNVRRGSSAALQELIGRHPNTIAEGISIVQTVDYHGVGLRQRAMTSIAYAASKLGAEYLKGLWDGLFGWRGIQASDKDSRNIAAASIGVLSQLMSPSDLTHQIERLIDLLNSLSRREVEWRHGLVMALASILSKYPTEIDHSETIADGPDLANPHQYWGLFEDALKFPPKELSTPSMRPELTSSSTLHLISAVGILSVGSQAPPSAAVLACLTTCLQTSDPSTVALVPRVCFLVGTLLSESEREGLAQKWKEELSIVINSPRRAGFMMALAALAFSESKTGSAGELTHSTISLLMDIYENHNVEARVMALRSLLVAVRGPFDVEISSVRTAGQTLDSQFLKVVEAGLNDYTINERGDVGSLVRIEAITTFLGLFEAGISCDPAAFASCQLAIERLSLERLNKVRLEAANCLLVLKPHSNPDATFSSCEYFIQHSLSMLSALKRPSQGETPAVPHTSAVTLEAFLTGISSSTGLASDSLMETARTALSALLAAIPKAPKPYHDLSLLAVANALLTLLASCIRTSNDRVLLPLLETASFLLDAGHFDQLGTDALPPRVEPSIAAADAAAKLRQPFKPQTLLALTQKAHYKSTSLPKLLVCVHVYRGIALLPGAGASVRAAVAKKLVGMLSHPFPKVRIAVAEAVFVVAGELVGAMVGSGGAGAEGDGDGDARPAATSAANVGRGNGNGLRDVDEQIKETLSAVSWGSGHEGERKAAARRVGGMLGVV